MCITKVEYSCKHKFEEIKPCSAYLDLCRRVKKANRNQSLWSCLFVHSTPICTAKPGKKSVFRHCDACERKARHEERGRRHQLAHQPRNAQAAQRTQERGRSEGKWKYRCEQCIHEERRPDERTRAANGGLCCARGLQEFSERERKEIRHRKPARTSKTDAPRPAHLPTRKECFPELQRMTSQQRMRIDATRAADRYGWSRTQRRDSEYLEAGLIKEYINTPGVDRRFIGRGPPVPEPLYEEPGIEWKRWDSAKQGNHGRLPPMPESPLPIIPLKTSRTRHVSSISRKPTPCRKQSVDLRCDHDSPVSPLSSPPSPCLSPISSDGSEQEQKPRSVMSDINHDLFEALGDWRSEPMPQPIQWRQVRW